MVSRRNPRLALWMNGRRVGWWHNAAEDRQILEYSPSGCVRHSPARFRFRSLGLRVPVAEIATFGSQKVLIVERFDRRLHPDGTWYLRIPQEDFCQVTGTPPLAKYEAEGGPGMREILSLLTNSSERARDRADFFKSQLVFRLLAAPDGHAKNFSVFIEAGGAFRMTPFYDVRSAWPVCGDGPGLLHRLKLAMAVGTRNVHYHMHEIRRRHWEEIGRRHALGPEVGSWIDEIADRVPRAIDAVRAQLPADFPAVIFEKIVAGLQGSVESLRR